MNYLKLTLSSVLQYFSDTDSIALRTNYNTSLYPTKRAIVGMIASAFGYERKDSRSKELFDSISDINKLQGWSFEFRPFEDSVVYETTCNGLPRRIIHDMKLNGVSIIDTIGPVKRPYYPGTSIYRRAQEDGESVTYYWEISRNIKVKDINNELQTEKRGEECNSKTKQYFFSESEIKKIKSVQEMIEKRVKGYLKRQW